ncbi:hypothetical protein OIO90_002107 [Microbotryomycetes sp. JL221]|nr:hypothetical protein OIO90_002107 [Microbotryomycetes sp. JL221]
MGIQGLLGMLKECQVVRHVREFKGKTLAVDAYVWLHRGAYSCPEQLATGQYTTKYVNYAMHRVRMLRHHGVEPFLVFDGGPLPSKSGTEGDRGRRRAEALARATSLVAEGKADLARDSFVKAVDVTPEMAYQLIKALRRENVQYVVAPYEADPQLAFLENQGIVDGVISEDSDLLVFGCKNVLFKMDGEGHCVSISRDDFTSCREYNFAGWTMKEFRQMAILSGCDYLDSIPGLGLKTAHKLLRRYKTAEKVIQFVRLEGNLKVPQTYAADFKRAELTFLHQHVFDPVQQCMTQLTLPPPNTELPFIGAAINPAQSVALARGDLNPCTLEPIVDLAGSSADVIAGPWTDLTYPPHGERIPELGSNAVFRRTSNAPAGPSLSTRKSAPAVMSGKAAITSFFKPVTPVQAKATSAAAPTLKPRSSSDPSSSSSAKGKSKADGIVVFDNSPPRASKFFSSSRSKSTSSSKEVLTEGTATVHVAAETLSQVDMLGLSQTAVPAESASAHDAAPHSTPDQAKQSTVAPTAWSSPVSTPPRSPAKRIQRCSPASLAIKREPLSGGALALSSAVTAKHKTVPEDSPVKRTGAALQPSSDCCLSSPPDYARIVDRTSLPPLSEIDEGISSSQQQGSKHECVESMVSSPAAATFQVKREPVVENEFIAATATVDFVKRDRPGSQEDKAVLKATRVVPVELSSDPIAGTSEPGEDIKPKPPRRVNAIQIKPTASIREGKRKSPARNDSIYEDEVDDEAAARTSQVASAWKQRFMLQRGTDSTPTGSRAILANAGLPTPASLTAKQGRSSTPSAVERRANTASMKKQNKRSLVISEPIVKKPKSSLAEDVTPRIGRRLPLSPKSIDRNRGESCSSIESHLLPGMTPSSSSSPPPPQPLQFEATTKASVATANSSSINPRLIRFKYIATLAQTTTPNVDAI